MKRIYVLFTALCVCCALAAQDIKELLILHTNDTHSRVEPIPITDPNPEFAGKAGFVRRVTLIKEIRKQDKDLLLFDCGDFSQGSPFYNMFGGEVEVKGSFFVFSSSILFSSLISFTLKSVFLMFHLEFFSIL